MFDKHIHHDFKPSLQLRIRRRDFLIDDKVVASKECLQYKSSEDRFDWWSDVQDTYEAVHVKDADELWNHYNLKVKN